MSKPFVGIKGITVGGTAVTNVHSDTWTYEQDDPSTKDLVNQLTGKPYYIDKENEGQKVITFTIGIWDDALYAKYNKTEVQYAAVVATTKTGGTITFPNAAIIAKANQVDGNIGLQIKAIACEPKDGSGDVIYAPADDTTEP